MADITEARAAKSALKASLSQIFGAEAASLIGQVGLGGGAPDSYCVNVRLERAPTAAEAARLPESQNGVPVEYRGPAGPIHKQQQPAP